MTDKRKSAYVEFDGTAFYFEIVEKEIAKHTASVTKHPVEKGADVTDHVKDMGDSITLDIYVSATPLRDVNQLYDGRVAGLELKVPKTEQPFVPLPGNAMQAGINAIKGVTKDNWKALTMQWPRAFNAPKDVLDQLLEWKSSATLGKVILADRTYENMVISDVTTTRDTEFGGGLAISLAFEGIRLVEARMVTAPLPSMPRAKTKVNKGKQPPVEAELTPEQRKSMLYKAREELIKMDWSQIFGGGK